MKANELKAWAAQYLNAEWPVAKARYDAAQEQLSHMSDVLQQFPSLSNGLTPDAVKATPEFQIASAEFNRQHKICRALAAVYTKKFKAEIRADRDARRAARVTAAKGA